MRTGQEAVGRPGTSGSFIQQLKCAGCMSSLACGEIGFVIWMGLLLILGVWLLVELLIPGIAFLLYLTVRAMLRQAARWHERCEGNPGASMFWAAVWSTVYLAPIGLIIWVVQLITRP